MKDFKTINYAKFIPDQPLVLVDYDHTVIKTELIRNWMLEKIQKLGFTSSQVRTTYEQAKSGSGSYSLDRHISLLCECKNMGVEELTEKIFLDICPPAEIVYADALDFLQQHYQKMNIVLFTLGDLKTQTYRAMCSSISKYLKGILIVETSKGQFLNDHLSKDPGMRLPILSPHSFPHLVMIDDHPREFKHLGDTSNKNIHLFRLRRKNGKYSEIESPDFVAEVNSLEDLEITF